MSDLEWCLQYVYSEISNKIISERKTDVVGIVGVHTDETQNMYGDQPDFENIAIISPIAQFNLASLLEAKAELVPNGDNGGDLISGIVVATQLIKLHTKTQKWIKNIVVLTNGNGVIDLHDEEGLIRQLNENNITLKVLGIDFDDAEAEYEEEDKPEEKRVNETNLRGFVEQLEDGVFATYKEARDSLEIPKVKVVNPVRAFSGDLLLNDPEQQSPERIMAIGIEAFPCTRRAIPMSAPSYAMIKQPTQTVSSLQSVKWERQYYVDDEETPGGRKGLDKEDLENGYRYGSEIVYISKEEEETLLLKTSAGLLVIGFVKKSTVPSYMLMGHTDYVLAQRGRHRDALAISAFSRALYELEYYAIARYVPKDGKDAQIVVLMPYLEANLEGLVLCQLPFAEDQRKYLFPSLTELKLKSGNKTVTAHSRLLPDGEMLAAMDDYVEAMDLHKLEEDDEPWLSIEDSFNPTIHHIKNTVKHCAVNQDCETIPAPLPILTRYSQAPDELVQEAKPQLELLKHLFDIKEEFREAKKRKTEEVTAKTGLDLNALLAGGGPQVKKEESTPSISAAKLEPSSQPSSQPSQSSSSQRVSIDPENIIPDFIRTLEKIDTKAGNDQEFRTGAEGLYKQTIALLEEKVASSVANLVYNEVVAVLETMKEQAEEMEITDIFQTVKKQFEDKLSNGDLGGQRNVLSGQIKAI